MKGSSAVLSTRQLTYVALFVALALVFRAVPIPPFLGGFFRFAALPLILAGFLLGPKCGFWVGAVSDLLEFVLFPTGKPFFPGFTLTQALTGCLPVLVARRLGSFRAEGEAAVRVSMPLLGGTLNPWHCLAGVAVGQIATKLVLVPLMLGWLLAPAGNYWAGWSVFFWQAVLTQLIHIPLYAWLSYWAVGRLNR